MEGFIKSYVVSSLVTLVRNAQESTTASPWYILGVTCNNNMFMVLLDNCLCSYQHVYDVAVCCPLFVYGLLILCRYKFMYKNIFKIYRE